MSRRRGFNFNSKIIGFMASLLMAQFAYALDFSPVVAVAYPGAEASSNTGNTFTNHSLAYGGGVLFGFSISSSFNADLGILYMPRGFGYSGSSLPSAMEMNFTSIQLPLILHYQLLPILTIGAGGYYSRGFGSISYYPAGSPATSTTASFGAGSFAADDYGIVTSVGFKFKILPFLGIILDGRYLLGLPNVSTTSGMTVYLRDLQVLGGIRFGGR